VRFAAEEILRRNANQGEALSVKVGAHLFPGHDKFVEDTFAKREKEIVELHEVKPDEVKDTFKPYDQEVRRVMNKFGYAAEEVKEEEGQNAEMASPAAEREQVDFAKEVKKVVAAKPWEALDHAAVEHCNKIFQKHNKDFMLLANLILEKGDGEKITDLSGIPYISEAENPKHVLQAIILQNAFHSANSQRVESVKESKYLGILTARKAS
jgi:hypothetical protein